MRFSNCLQFVDAGIPANMQAKQREQLAFMECPVGHSNLAGPSKAK